MTAAAPIVARAEPPAFVRSGSKAVKEAWQEGQLFEALLLEQLSGLLFTESETGLGGPEAESAGGEPLLAAFGPSLFGQTLAGAAPFGIATAFAEAARQREGKAAGDHADGSRS